MLYLVRFHVNLVTGEREERKIETERQRQRDSNRDREIAAETER